MNADQRAERLEEKAVELGCETPTIAMIAEAIHDAEFDTYQDIAESLRQDGHAAAAESVEQWKDRQYDKNIEG